MRACLKKTVLLLCAGLSMTAARAESETYVFDTQHTYPNFEVGHLGYSVRRG